MVPPASRIRVTTVASMSRTYPRKAEAPFIIGTPARPERRGPGGRPPCRVPHRGRFVNGPRRARVTAAGEAEVFAMRLADDGAPRVENPRDHRGVDVGHVPSQG